MQTTQPIERMALSVAEAGQALGVSRAKAYELAATGSIPTVKLGGRLVVPADALRRMLDERATSKA